MVSCTLEIVHRLSDSAFAPTIIFAVLAALAMLLRLNRLPVPWKTLSALITIVVLLAATTYLFLPILFEDAETNIACIAALAMRGQPVYPAPDAAARYILLYGPLTYLAHIPFYLVFGENLVSFKLLGVGALFTSVFSTYKICRKYCAPQEALIGVGCASLIFFRYMGVTFWGRIDPVILAAVAVSIWAILDGPIWLTIATAALSVAIIPNLKVSGAAYLVPVLVLLMLRRGWKVAAVSAAIGLALFPLPFLLPQVSLRNYLFALGAAAQHGIVIEFLIRNLQYSVLGLAPVLAIAFHGKLRLARDQKFYLASIAVSLLASCFLGAKNGAGSYHLIPFLVPILHLYVWVRSERLETGPDTAFAKFAIPWVLTMLLLSSTHLRTALHEFRGSARAHEAVREVSRAEATYRGQTIEVGVGSEFRDLRTRYGYLTTFDGQPYTISGAAIRDLQFGGVEIPERTIHYIEGCRTKVWLIPSGGAPFSALNTYYATAHPGFEKPFLNAFLSHYHKSAAGKLFDVWTCD